MHLHHFEGVQLKCRNAIPIQSHNFSMFQHWIVPASRMHDVVMLRHCDATMVWHRDAMKAAER
jgi:hypothetical protein